MSSLICQQIFKIKTFDAMSLTNKRLVMSKIKFYYIHVLEKEK